MSFLLVDDDFPGHKKVTPLTDQAFRLHVTAMCDCMKQLTDGLVTHDRLDVLPKRPVGAALKKTIEQLETLGLWERRPDGWQIHDFLDWNQTAEQVRAKQESARERMRKKRSLNVRANTQRTDPEQSANIPATFAVGSRNVQPPGTGTGSGSKKETMGIPDDVDPSLAEIPRESPRPAPPSPENPDIFSSGERRPREVGKPPKPRPDLLFEKIPAREYHPTDEHRAYAAEVGIDSDEFEQVLVELRDKYSAPRGNLPAAGHDLPWWDGKMVAFIDGRARAKATPRAAPGPANANRYKRQPDCGLTGFEFADEPIPMDGVMSR